MQFDFYLNNLSFRKTEGLTVETLRRKIEQLADDHEFIRDNKERIFRHPSIYDEEIINDWRIVDLHNPAFVSYLGRDPQFLLQIIIDQSTHTDIDNELVTEMLDSHTPEQINGLLCLHEVTEVNPTYCVYDKNDWYAFHRYFLSVYPPVRTEFCQSIAPYFPNLHFNESSVTNGLNGLSQSYDKIMQTIVFHLSALNDEFYSIFQEDGISGDGACDELENRYKNKEIKLGASRDSNDCIDITFVFEDTSGDRPLYCDLHTKFRQYFEINTPSTDDLANRIYFHQPIEGFKENKVLIGRIGEHSRKKGNTKFKR